MIRSYSTLSLISNFEDRFEYLKLSGEVGTDTFGFDRYLNQQFYTSRQWRNIRDLVVYRDAGFDLGFPENPIFGKIIIHHMNPIGVDDILKKSEILMNPEYLVCVSHETHNAIHYGDKSLIIKPVLDRTPNDTIPWK